MLPVRIYFGRNPHWHNQYEIDRWFNCILENHNYNYQEAVDRIITKIFNLEVNPSRSAYTTNPLILNFFDDEFAKNNVWFIDDEGNHIQMGDDREMLYSLKWYSIGEALCNNYRVLP
jgi:hypothetical protein